MKIRNGFISNSSSSSFVIDKVHSKNIILKFTKELFVKRSKERIDKILKSKNNYCDNYLDVVQYIKNDITNIDKLIKIEPIKDIKWDLSEYFDLNTLDKDDWLLYDTEDNILNWLDEEIELRFNVKDRILHQ